jgi:hypothetical protein
MICSKCLQNINSLQVLRQKAAKVMESLFDCWLHSRGHDGIPSSCLWLGVEMSLSIAQGLSYDFFLLSGFYAGPIMISHSEKLDEISDLRSGPEARATSSSSSAFSRCLQSYVASQSSYLLYWSLGWSEPFKSVLHRRWATVCLALPFRGAGVTCSRAH